MFLQKIHQTIKEYIGIEAGTTIVVGVSGGADSVSLLTALHILAEEYCWKLIVCHVEHGLRGVESKEDAKFVEQLAQTMNLPFALGEFQVKLLAKELKVSTQVAARMVRYDFFENVMQQYGADYLALAHHADDQAETILMRIIRGTSTSGLSGMAVKRNWRKYIIIRPLLTIWRNEIEKFCEQNQLLYRTDSSNVSTKYLRNKIRLELIPLLEHAYNPNIKERLLKLSDISRSEDEYLEKTANMWLDEHCQYVEKQFINLSRAAFQKLDIALQPRVIKLILYYLSGHTTSWESIHIETIKQYLLDTRNIQDSLIAHGVYCRCEYDFVQLHTYVETPKALPSYEFNKAGIQMIQYGSFVIYSEVIQGNSEQPRKQPSGKWEAAISLDDIGDIPIHIRSRRTGDTIQPYGMNGTAKVKKLMIDHKVPVSFRDLWPIVEIGERIVWVMGIRRSKHFLVQPDTKTIMYIRAVFPESSIHLQEC